jgi:hypothetical protein
VPRKIFGPKKDKVNGEWRKVQNEELHSLYSSTSEIRNDQVKKDEMGRECNKNGPKVLHIGYWWEREKKGPPASQKPEARSQKRRLVHTIKKALREAAGVVRTAMVWFRMETSSNEPSVRIKCWDWRLAPWSSMFRSINMRFVWMKQAVAVTENV